MSASAAFRRARPGSLTIDAAAAQSRAAGPAQSDVTHDGSGQGVGAGSGSATTPLAHTASPLPSVPASGSLPGVATTPNSAGAAPSLSSFQRQTIRRTGATLSALKLFVDVDQTDRAGERRLAELGSLSAILIDSPLPLPPLPRLRSSGSSAVASPSHAGVGVRSRSRSQSFSQSAGLVEYGGSISPLVAADAGASAPIGIMASPDADSTARPVNSALLVDFSAAPRPQTVVGSSDASSARAHHPAAFSSALPPTPPISRRSPALGVTIATNGTPSRGAGAMTGTPGASDRSLNSGSGDLSGRSSASLTSYSSESPPSLHHSTTAATPLQMFNSNANANAGSISSNASVHDIVNSMTATSIASPPSCSADSSSVSSSSSSSSTPSSFLSCAASPYGPAVGALIRQRSKSTRRRFIGQGEWASLSQLTEFTEPELERLHAVFCARQTNGLLAQAPFWRVVAETHGFFAPSDTGVDDDGDSDGWARAAANSASQNASAPADDRSYLRVYLDENSLLAARMYSIFDVLKFGSLTFLEFVLAFAVMCARSTFLDRVTFAFDVFDLQQDQRVSADELHMCAVTVNIALALAQQQREQQQQQQPPHAPSPPPARSGSSTPSSAAIRSPSRSSPSASAGGRSSASAAAASPKDESHAAAAQRLTREAAAVDRVARLYERALQSCGSDAESDAGGRSVGKDAFRRMVEAHTAILEPFTCTFDMFCRNVPLVSEL